MPRDKKQSGSLIYGPVPSRRLGLSLGVDLVPYKTCTFDFIYCQIGRTAQTTTERRPYVEPEMILSELKLRLEEGAAPDFITLGGSGEPCLNSEIGRIIKQIRQISDIEVAVLTNGSLLWSGQVRAELAEADVVLPSLDAYDRETFRKINRPDPCISFDAMIGGLAEFRKVYSGRIWLEIFIVRGINDTEEAMAAFRSHVEKIAPDKIHINTAVRPTAEDYAGQVSGQRLERLASVLGHGAEVVAEFRESSDAVKEKETDSRILDMVSRRPCTASDIAAGLGIEETFVERRMSEFSDSGIVETKKSRGRIYYLKKFEIREQNMP
ncbi:MAG: radical SAM protein [Desulfosalsimonas sp.]